MLNYNLPDNPTDEIYYDTSTSGDVSRCLHDAEPSNHHHLHQLTRDTLKDDVQDSHLLSRPSSVMVESSGMESYATAKSRLYLCFFLFLIEIIIIILDIN